MSYMIGTQTEALNLRNRIPKEIFDLLYETVTVLDENYGTQRDYTKEGGYCIIAEAKESFPITEAMIPEWEEKLQDYIARLYLLGDDFAIVLFMRGEEK